MMTQLSVRHLAVVEDLSLQFQSGMTSLTGETGAGKSMLVDALSLVLGDRADSNMIRQGHDRAEIEASFDLHLNPALHDWLKQQELDDEDSCQLRRTISRDGRSKAYINGRQVPLTQLKSVSERAVDIHGQHAHQSLLRAETQRELLDVVADNKALLTQLKQAYKDWQHTQQQLLAVEQQAEQNTARLELLTYQVEELSAHDLTAPSIETLLQQQQQLANAAELVQSCEVCLDQVFDQEQGAAYDAIGQAIKSFEKLHTIEPRFAPILETLNSALINLDESATAIRHYLDHSELDTSLLDEVETQLAQLHDLARKHHIDIEALPALYSTLSAEYSALSQAGQSRTSLEKACAQAQQTCVGLTEEIRQRRQAVIPTLSKQITDSIQQLAMPSGKVEFTLEPFATGEFSEHGADQIKLLVTTNPGQPSGELAKIASGGELARISLAIQVVTAGKRTVPTLIFDEVDVGIGGGVAEIVGQHLRVLASTQQVICITHLPQVASQAHQQLQVRKQFAENSTHIEIEQLTYAQRIEEIARMLGGMNLTEKTRSHAQEMLEQSQR